jgi:hypothetical protein
MQISWMSICGRVTKCCPQSFVLFSGRKRAITILSLRNNILLRDIRKGLWPTWLLWTRQSIFRFHRRPIISQDTEWILAYHIELYSRELDYDGQSEGSRWWYCTAMVGHSATLTQSPSKQDPWAHTQRSCHCWEHRLKASSGNFRSSAVAFDSTG